MLRLLIQCVLQTQAQAAIPSRPYDHVRPAFISATHHRILFLEPAVFLSCRLQAMDTCTDCNDRTHTGRATYILVGEATGYPIFLRTLFNDGEAVPT
jgi:hypothetical protein